MEQLTRALRVADHPDPDPVLSYLNVRTSIDLAIACRIIGKNDAAAIDGLQQILRTLRQSAHAAGGTSHYMDAVGEDFFQRLRQKHPDFHRNRSGSAD